MSYICVLRAIPIDEKNLSVQFYPLHSRGESGARRGGEGAARPAKKRGIGGHQCMTPYGLLGTISKNINRTGKS